MLMSLPQNDEQFSPGNGGWVANYRIPTFVPIIINGHHGNRCLFGKGRVLHNINFYILVRKFIVVIEY